MRLILNISLSTGLISSFSKPWASEAGLNSNLTEGMNSLIQIIWQVSEEIWLRTLGLYCY